MSPAVLIPVAAVAVAPGKLMAVKGAGAADKAMFDAGGVHVVAYDLSSIVDADGLRPSSAGEVYVAEGAATLGEAMPHAGARSSSTPRDRAQRAV